MNVSNFSIFTKLQNLLIAVIYGKLSVIDKELKQYTI
jgi:hypothetical protein